MKKTCIKPSAVALPVSVNMKMVSANWLMALASTEMICPSQTMVNANMPVGRFG